MVYMTDVEAETKVSNPQRQKDTFKSTFKKEAVKIKLMKDYFETGDLKPMEDYWDRLLKIKQNDYSLIV